MPLEARIPRSIHEAFAKSAVAFADRTALTMVMTGADAEESVQVSYANLYERITRAANLFSAVGGQGVGVAYMLPMLIETQVVLWAAESVGYAVPLNPLLQPEQLIDLISMSGAGILVTCGPAVSPQLWESCQAIQKQLPQLQVICIGGAAGLDGPVIDFNTATRQTRANELDLPAPADLDRVVAYFHTGGTTGSPKLVAHTQRNQLSAALGAAALLAMGPDDVLTNGMPMFHVGGAIACSLAPFMSGAHVLILSPLGLRSPDIIRNYWRIVERYGATIAGAVPTALSAILSHDVDASLKTVRYGITGAASMPRSLAEKFSSMTGLPLHEILGMTESGGVTAVDPIAAPPTLSSVGLRLPYTRIEVLKRREDGSLGEACKPHEIGVLVISGPTVSPGYRDARQNGGVFVDGKLNSGDLAYFDEDGKLFIAGRAKDLIIRSGHNIDPSMIEAAFTAHPQVAMAAAVGQPDSYAGELPVCYLTLAPNATATPDELQAFARERIDERPAWPKQVYVLATLPVTGVGKVYKPALRADAAIRLVEPLLEAALGEKWGTATATDGGPRGMSVQITLSSDDPAAQKVAHDILKPFLFDHSINPQKDTAR